MQNSNRKRETSSQEDQETNLLATNTKEEKHTNITLSVTAKVAGNNKHYSLISANINGFNSPIKRNRLSDWIHKQSSTFCCIQETHLRDKDRYSLRVKGWEKNLPSKWPQETSWSTILKLNKVDFQPKVINKDKDMFYSLQGKFIRRNSQSSTYLHYN